MNTSCEHCCACCLEQESPPGYVMILSLGYGDPRDRARLDRMPVELVAELRAYLDELRAMPREEMNDSDPSCIRLDKKNRRCLHHEWRPQICRDFQPGTKYCRNWQRNYPNFSPLQIVGGV